MKKYLLSIFAVLLCLLSVSACGAGNVGSAEYMAAKQQEQEQANTPLEQSQLNSEPVWSNDFNGLLDCFEYRGYVNADTKTPTLANVIGAKDGYKYISKIGKNQFEIELYYFDIDNLSDKANNILTQVNETGYFDMLDVNLKAVVSNDFKYMVIYKNKAEDQDSLAYFDELASTLKDF